MAAAVEAAASASSPVNISFFFIHPPFVLFSLPACSRNFAAFLSLFLSDSIPFPNDECHAVLCPMPSHFHAIHPFRKRDEIKKRQSDGASNPASKQASQPPQPSQMHNARFFLSGVFRLSCSCCFAVVVLCCALLSYSWIQGGDWFDSLCFFATAYPPIFSPQRSDEGKQCKSCAVEVFRCHCASIPNLNKQLGDMSDETLFAVLPCRMEMNVER